jgi:hypothetical protein
MTPAQFPNAHVIYTITVPHISNGPLYVGTCKLAYFHQLPDAKLNSEYRRIVQPTDQITIAVLTIHPVADDIFNHAYQALIDAYTPHCNINGTTGQGGRIRCVETGQEYASVNEAAKAIGVSRQAMSAHLHGVLKTVRNCTFQRIAS